MEYFIFLKMKLKKLADVKSNCGNSKIAKFFFDFLVSPIDYASFGLGAIKIGSANLFMAICGNSVTLPVFHVANCGN